MKIKFLICFLLSFLISFNIFASEWKIDQANSKIEFSGNQANKKFTGIFKSFDGDIKFDPANLADSSAKIRIDLSSAFTGDTTYDKSMPQKDWFDVSSNQFAYYETTKFTKLAGDEYQIDGFLTIRGIKVAQNFKAKITINNDIAKLKSSTNVARMNFGIGKSSDSSGSWVSLSIPVKIEIAANKIASN